MGVRSMCESWMDFLWETGTPAERSGLEALREETSMTCKDCLKLAERVARLEEGQRELLTLIECERSIARMQSVRKRLLVQDGPRTATEAAMQAERARQLDSIRAGLERPVADILRPEDYRNIERAFYPEMEQLRATACEKIERHFKQAEAEGRAGSGDGAEREPRVLPCKDSHHIWQHRGDEFECVKCGWKHSESVPYEDDFFVSVCERCLVVRAYMPGDVVTDERGGTCLDAGGAGSRHKWTHARAAGARDAQR